jgi:uncharacterized oligopeptide transporter (OPT) family protein
MEREVTMVCYEYYLITETFHLPNTGVYIHVSSMTKKDETWLQVLPAPTEAILESISDGVFTVDLDWCMTSFN